MRHEIISPTHNLSKYEKELGVSIHSEELQWILYRHVFLPIYAMYYKSSHARTFTLNGGNHDVMS